MEKLRAVFEDDNFRKEYFDYNLDTKHCCTPGVYKDFCCGEMFKKNPLFIEQPYAIQIQIFLDAFETCNPLKSKTGIHGVVGVYFSIRNMPSRFAYNLANIHLLAVVNEIDLKKAETDYSNIWEPIMGDVKVLEIQGLHVADNFVLKGIC